MKKSTKYSLLLFGIVIIFIYFITRLVNLTSLPIFTDEAIYIRWSQIGSRDSNWRFISLTDGKQPMFTWVMMVFFKFIKDPLLAGRLVSVFSGFVTLTGLVALSSVLFKKLKIGLFAVILYLFSPFFLMYDRLALYDSMVAMFSVWSLTGIVYLVKSFRLDTALILGFILGGGILNKTSGFLSIYLIPTSVLLLGKFKEIFSKKIIKLSLLFIVSVTISFVMYAVLKLSPFYHIISDKNSIFVYPLSEWLDHPTRFVLGNFNGQMDWLVNYMTYPIFILSLISLFFINKNFKEKLFLFIWWLMPFFALALFGKVLYPRFILFMTIPLYVLAAWTIEHFYKTINNKKVFFIILLVLLIPALKIDYGILFNILNAGIPKSDRNQLLDDWPAGYGVKEAISYFNDKIKTEKINIYTEGTFGLLPYSIEAYLVDHNNVNRIEGIWPLPVDIPDTIKQESQKNLSYLILNQTQVPPAGWKLEFISKYQKGNNKYSYLSIYKILPY